MALVAIAKYTGSVGDPRNIRFVYTAALEGSTPISDASVLIDISGLTTSKINKAVVKAIIEDAAARGQALEAKNLIYDTVSRG